MFRGQDSFVAVNNTLESSLKPGGFHVEEGLQLCSSEAGTALPGHVVASLCLHVNQVASRVAKCPALGITKYSSLEERLPSSPRVS